MEKLVELLNEYEKTLEPNLQIEWTEVGIKSTPELVISKKFGFIKWLVENEKIDFKKLDTPRFNHLVDNTLDSYLALLMALSIQDAPIELLISILK